MDPWSRLISNQLHLTPLLFAEIAFGSSEDVRTRRVKGAASYHMASQNSVLELMLTSSLLQLRLQEGKWLDQGFTVNWFLQVRIFPPSALNSGPQYHWAHSLNFRERKEIIAVSWRPVCATYTSSWLSARWKKSRYSARQFVSILSAEQSTGTSRPFISTGLHEAKQAFAGTGHKWADNVHPFPWVMFLQLTKEIHLC